MAENEESSMDYAEHERAYETFLWIAKWSTIIVALVLILMATILV